MKYMLLLLFLILPIYAQVSQPSYLTVKDLSTISSVNGKVGKIILENNLHVYLISNPYVQQSAAAMAIEVGSWNDPEEYPGMAHFLEHLLFEGTKAYPKEFEYSQFIRDHGGFINASTHEDKTIYAFTINTDAYSQALDRFSHFFIDPLLSCNSINQELHIVNQEYAKNMENDNWRLLMVLKETGNPFHPNRYFSIGNEETLSQIPQIAVQDWYTANYSASRMHLVMISSLPLAQMKNLAVEHFSTVDNKGYLEASQNGSLLSLQQKGSMVFIKPVKDITQLDLKWEIPLEFSRLDDKLPEFLAYILRKQVKGSLFAKLKDQNLIEGLSVNVIRFSKESQIFSINLSLTEQGLLERDLVVFYVFAALERLKTELPNYLFEEFKLIKNLRFTKSSLDPLFETVMEYSSNMIYEDLSTYPDKTNIPSVFDSQKFRRFLYTFTPSDCAYFLIADPSKIGVVLDRKEKWMQAEYAITPIDSKSLSNWLNISIDPEITLPRANPYLLSPKDIPEVIYHDEGFQAYFSRAHSAVNGLTFQFKTPFLDKTPKSQVLAALWHILLQDILADDLSFASDAGIHGNLGISLTDLSITFSICGSNENVFLLTKKVFSALKQVDCSQEKFQICLRSLASQYENIFKDLPIDQATDEIQRIISGGPSRQQNLLALKNITKEDFCEFSEKFTQYLYTKAFLYIDLSQAQAMEFLNELQAILDAKPYPVSQHKARTLVFPSSDNPSKLTIKTQQQGAAAVLFLQQGLFSFESKAVQNILSCVLEGALFDVMRNQTQLAYIVQAETIEEGKHLLQSFSVQSCTNTANDLLERFELFLRNFDKNLQTEIPFERFEQIRSIVIDALESQSSSLSDYLERSAILAFYRQDFDWTKKLITSLSTISYDDFCKIAHQMLSNSIPRLAVLVEGEVPTEKNNFYQEFFSREDITSVLRKE